MQFRPGVDPAPFKWRGVAGLLLALLGLHAAQAARISTVSPLGEVAVVRQVVVQFDSAVVPAGDPRLPPPVTLRCNGRQLIGNDANADRGRWTSSRRWVYDLPSPLDAGSRCKLQVRAGFSAIDGSALQGQSAFEFSTGAPAVLSVAPTQGSTIDEDQAFLLRLNGTPDADSVRRSAWCEIEGLGERVPVRIVEGEALAQVLKARGATRNPEQRLLLACQRSFAPEARVRLVWGAGITAAAPTAPDAPVSTREQRFSWTVRARFSAEFQCERENAQSPCLPLRPMTLRFSAPVPLALAMAARLTPTDKASGGEARAPRDERSGAAGIDPAATVSAIQFDAPLPEGTRFTLSLPAALRDDAGRALANTASFPLTVATGPMPPLAKFAGGGFGILEASSDPKQAALLPLTVRRVQADLQRASTGGRIAFKRLDASASDADLLRWVARIRDDQQRQFKTRMQSLLTNETGVQRVPLPAAAAAAASGSTPRATEVIGVPLPQRGLHVVEVESRILGDALLQSRGPMYARTAALVTNLGVHLKRGRSSGLVWVTSLDRGRPVANAAVVVNDCRGQPLWQGSTGADGIARIDRGFAADAERDPYADDAAPRKPAAPKCLSEEGLFVSARVGGDVAFVFSGWNRGIEPWRFDIPTSSVADLQPDRQAHTVFDRTLLRAGETVSMKHFLRLQTARGLALPASADLPDTVVLSHVGSGAETRLPLAWPTGARASESTWKIPTNAALGAYDVALEQRGAAGAKSDANAGDAARDTRRIGSGSFRVEAFRVPLVDARLAPPSGAQVAPSSLTYQASLDALGGGPMAGAAVTLSAVLQPAVPLFSNQSDFSFNPPSRAPQNPSTESAAEEEEASGASDSRTRIVARNLPATTGKQGSAALTIDPLPALEGPADVVAELAFDDPNGERQTIAQRTRLWPAALVVGLRVPGWTAARKRFTVDAVVLDTEGRPLAGRTVQVRARLNRTVSIRKRLVGGFYAYDNRRESKDLGEVCKATSDARGRIGCTVDQLDDSGEVELIASATDNAGRTSEAASTVWVSRGGAWWFAQNDDDRIDVLPEQREVEPGGVARLQVRMPYRQATALVTVEREGIVEARVVTLSGSDPVIELPVPAGGDTQASWAPNVMVGVLVLRGRLREAPWWSIFTWGWRNPRDWWQAFRYEDSEHSEPTATVDLAKPSYKFGVAQLSVGLAAQRLDVSVRTDKSDYKVREVAQATVRVTHRGQPVAGAQIAFAAVDEGLLALQPNRSWELLTGLLQPRPWGVETATAQGEIVGRRHYGRKTLPPGGGGGRNPTRELFDTLLLWRGTVVLDAKGEARIDVPLNDSLTRFRLVAIADAGADAGAGAGKDGLERFGDGSTTINVTQDLQMLSGLPPLVREGDRIDAVYTLRNTTRRSMRLRATLQGKASEQALPSNPPQELTLAAGASTRVSWPLQIPSGIDRIDWLAEVAEVAGSGPASAAATASGGAAAALLTDRLQTAMAVVPAVPVRVWQASLQPIDAGGSVSIPVSAPAGARPGAGGIAATLSPRLAGDMPGVRRYFQTYPYTCLEQKASRSIGLRDTAAWATLRDQAAGYLDSDGLASYFPPAPGSPPQGSDRLTAYLVSTADAAGWAWPDTVRDAMLAGLAAFVEGRIERRFYAPRADLAVRKLSALEALARHGRVVPRMLDSVAWTPAVWPTSALLDAWSLYRRVDGLPKREARIDELQRLIRSRLQAGGTTLTFSTEADDDWWWLMEGADANATRLLLMAADSPAWREEVPQLVTGALARQRRGAWNTTTANLWGVLALERFAAVFETVPVSGTTTLQLAADRTQLAWQAEPQGGRRLLPWPGSSPAGAASASAASTAASQPVIAFPAIFSASHDGAGRPWLSLQSLAAVPLQAPLSAGYRIVRSVSAVDAGGTADSVASAAAAAGPPRIWTRGDPVRVRLDIEASTDMGWVVISDPVPAGATLLGSGLGRDSVIATRSEQPQGSGWLAYEERGTAVWRAYYEWLPRGRHRIEYTMRLNASGRFGLPPSRVEAMYAPETFGESPNEVIEVRP